MTENNNRDTAKEILNATNLQVAVDKIPSKVGDTILPTIEVNPEVLRKINVYSAGICENATSTTIYTTPSDKDFYLCGMAINVIKDVTSTSNLSYINIYPEGKAGTQVCLIPSISLTPQETCKVIPLQRPLKLSRGTAINVNNATNVANIKTIGEIWGYTTEIIQR